MKGTFGFSDEELTERARQNAIAFEKSNNLENPP
jgi:hypothetical protein